MHRLAIAPYGELTGMLSHATYLVFELCWAIPVLIVQWALGWRALWRRRRVLLVAVAIPTLYLSCADAVAITNGIWTLHSSRILGLRLGDLPVEEAIFFLLTNAMVVQSLILVDAYAHLLRARWIPLLRE